MFSTDITFDFKTDQVIRFILDGSVKTVENVDPQLTLLQYLRETLLLTGTKEGCAEGDCGACTVVVGELVDDKISLRSVNACIQFLPMIHGKVLFTVESLSHGSDLLHPVQQAMVDNHGSQCGFCTPGFIMSLFALFKNTANPDRLQINDALSGNLCRCTGYRPIIEAANQMYAQSVETLPGDQEKTWLTQPAQKKSSTQAGLDENDLIEQLKSIHPENTLLLQQNNRRYFAPVKIEELAELVETLPQATLVAGNTDVGLWVNKQLRDLPEIINLTAVRELKEVSQNDGKLTIGAAVSLSDAFASISEHFPQLDDLFRRFASMPVRNAGTLVGNVANGSPIGDTMPALLVLNTEVVLRKGKSQRTLPLDKFYLGYQQKDLQAGEFVEAVRIPLDIDQPDGNPGELASYKISKRYDQDIAAVCAAFKMNRDEFGVITQIKIAFGGMAATPKNAEATEKALLGQQWNQSSVDIGKSKLAEDFAPLSDMRASADYRLKVAQNLLQRFYLETHADFAQTQTQLRVSS